MMFKESQESNDKKKCPTWAQKPGSDPETLTLDGYKSLPTHPGTTSTKAGRDLLGDKEAFGAVRTTCCYPLTRKPY